MIFEIDFLESIKKEAIKDKYDESEVERLWFIFADWLGEHGDERGELIQLAIDWHKNPIIHNDVCFRITELFLNSGLTMMFSGNYIDAMCDALVQEAFGHYCVYFPRRILIMPSFNTLSLGNPIDILAKGVAKGGGL